MQEPEALDRIISLEDDAFIVSFEYDPAVVTKIRQFPERMYIPARKVWLVPPWPELATRLLAFAEEEQFCALDSVWDELRRLAELEPSVKPVNHPAGIVRHVFRAPNGGILLHTEPNPSLTEVIKEATGAYWDARVKALRLPFAPQIARAVLHCVDSYDFFIEPAEHERMLVSIEELDESGEDPFAYLSVPDIVALRLLLQIPEHRRDTILNTLRNITFKGGY